MRISKTRRDSSPCGPEPSGLRPPKGFGPPPALRPRAFGRRAGASAEGGPQAGDGSSSANLGISPALQERIYPLMLGARWSDPDRT
jgi:hypothetical protein